ncbi:YdbL family protein [Paraglaciecola aquimarina]|uniref:YdbL family protein n=1 Tax=Paraglaciecola aquimarina TaxID=1235557 RepID=A0ABU3T2B3_9ALTE|nr:YdbL family protein [Paraglaciecola aquimarina]MDU0356406.1 YdbL family protein [Paraglaciecola aquimarina]
MKNKMILNALLMIAFLFSSIVFALELDEAKQKGLVGEKDNGYLGVVVAQNDAQSLVTEINEKRKEVYKKLASKNGITLQQVEKLAAQKAYQKTSPGHYLWTNGQWVKK